MKVSRNSKTKRGVQTDVPLQLISKNSNVECIVTAADGCNSVSSLEKRRREANKPIYLKRV